LNVIRVYQRIMS